MRATSVARWGLICDAAGGRRRGISISAAVKKKSKKLRKFFGNSKAARSDNPEAGFN